VLQSKPMPLSDAGGATGTPETPLTLLGSMRELDDGDLPRLYDYPERDGTWLRANFITSADGGATADGSSGAMGGPGDRQIFSLLRELADVIVVGAGTVRIENYSGVHLGVAERQGRQAREQSEVPRLAIVTKSGRLDRDMAVFTRTELPPLVLTCTAAAEKTRRLLGDLCEVVDCSGGDPGEVDEAALLEALAARGMRRILTEGGPTLLGTFVQRDLLDELCLTIAPYLVGGLARRIATGSGQVLTHMRCAHILTYDAGYLYTRYVKA
jgi:riboflavin biosynthesis pyrimidine reductase